MAKLTKADAARQLGIARSTLYKLIDQGKLSPTPDGMIDQAELVRVAATWTPSKNVRGHPQTPVIHPYQDMPRHRTDIRRQVSTNSDIQTPASVRRRLQTSWWTSYANSSKSSVKNCRKPAQAPKRPVNVKHCFSKCSSKCSSGT